MRAALDSIDRDFVYSLCQYGMGQVWQWGAQVGGNLWRVTGDINDSWGSMSGIGFAQTGHEQYAGPGHWNDTDMLVVGMLGWGDSLRPTRLTPDEQITHITLWSLQAAPLLIGADLTQLDQFTTNLLGQRRGAGSRPGPARHAPRRAWRRSVVPRSGPGILRTAPWRWGCSIAIWWRNRSPSGGAILACPASQPVRDLWLHKNLGAPPGSITISVPRHGAVLIKVGRPRS